MLPIGSRSPDVRVRTSGDLAATIRGRRLELGMSQILLADMAGVSRKWLWDVERGKTSADFGLLLRVLPALGLALDIAPLGQDASVDRDARGQLDAILDKHR